MCDFVTNNCGPESIYQVVDEAGETIANCVSEIIAMMIAEALNSQK